jgi:very-short-patch-repair endonuclease
MSSTSPVDHFKRQTARRLRVNATEAEMRLWRTLRTLPTFGTHFRRQVPIGPYIADFACLAARLVIELDGSQHARDDNAARDQVRTQWLEREGYKVLRFWNSDLTQNRSAVLEAIYAALYGALDGDAAPIKHERRTRSLAPHPTPARVARRPSPSRGG